MLRWPGTTTTRSGLRSLLASASAVPKAAAAATKAQGGARRALFIGGSTVGTCLGIDRSIDPRLPVAG
jgi:hypothetical protein